MKISYASLLTLLLTILLSFPQNLDAQSEKGEEGYVPERIIMWEKIGQREELNKCEEHLIIYTDAEPELTYMRYIESRDERKYIVELSTFSTLSKPKAIDVTKSIRIPIDGSSPISLKRSSKDAVRNITFSKLGQREKVLSGEVVNVVYDGIKIENAYISFESYEDGYWLELTSLLEQKVVSFEKRCQLFIVASPSTTTLRIDDRLVYEQIIWTPRVDNSWEVRIGTVEQGCKSAALKAIRNLRTREYERNVPVVKKKTRGRR